MSTTTCSGSGSSPGCGPASAGRPGPLGIAGTVRHTRAPLRAGTVRPRAPVPAPQPRLVIRISTRSAVLAVVGLAMVAQRVFVAAHTPLSWAAAAAVVAVLIDPIVDTLDRRIPRLPAVIIALLVAGPRPWA